MIAAAAEAGGALERGPPPADGVQVALCPSRASTQMTAQTSPKPRILTVSSTGLPPERVAELSAAHPGVDIVATPDTAEAIFAAAPGIAAMIGCPRHIFSDELLEKAGPSLRWIHASGAGCKEFLTPALINSDIVLTNGRIIQGPEVADHAFALLLALTRNLHYILRGRRPSSMPRPLELRGKVAVVVGLGGVGMLIAERAVGFGMKVIGVNPDYVPMVRMFERVVPPECMRDVLPEADVVFCAGPHTAATYRMFADPEFATMKPNAFFINVSRGQLVDSDALVEALGRGHLAGVGLDVTDPEPLPDDHPLRRIDRVIITPHIAGLSEFNRQRSFKLIKENIGRFIAGLPLYNVVNKRLGY